MKKIFLLFLTTSLSLYADTLQQINGYVDAGDLNRAIEHVGDVTGMQRSDILNNVIDHWSPTAMPQLARDIKDAATNWLTSAEAQKIFAAVNEKVKAVGAIRRGMPGQPGQPGAVQPVVQPVAQPVQPAQPLAPVQPIVQPAVPPAPPLVPPAPPLVPAAPAGAPNVAPARPKPVGPGGILKSILPARGETPITDYYQLAIGRYDGSIRNGNISDAKLILGRLITEIGNDEKSLGETEYGELTTELRLRGLYPLANLKASYGNGQARVLTAMQQYYLEVAIPAFDQFIKDNNADGAAMLLGDVIIQEIKDANIFEANQLQLVGLLKQLRDRGLYPITTLYTTAECIREMKKQPGSSLAGCIKKAAAAPITRPTEPLAPKQVVDQFALDAAKLIGEGNFTGALKAISAARIGNRKLLLLQIIDSWSTAKNTLTSKDVNEAATNLSSLDKIQIERSMAAVEEDPNAATAFSFIGSGEYGQAFILLASIKKEYRLPVFLQILDMWRDKTKPANGTKLPAPITIERIMYTRVDYGSMRARAGMLLTGADLEWANKVLESIKKSE